MDSWLLTDLADIDTAVSVLVVVQGLMQRPVGVDRCLGTVCCVGRASPARDLVVLAAAVLAAAVLAAVLCSELVLEVVEPVVVKMALIACQLVRKMLARLGHVEVVGSEPPESKSGME